jgi:tRNA1(Val) A37 N6-methylase TrmN6
MAEPAELSADRVLGGRVLLNQPKSGYRVAIDPILLAAAVPASAGDRALDIGAGVGAAALCLATRIAGVRVFGIERERDLVGLANQNALANQLDQRVEILFGDLLRPPPLLSPRSFDHVLANPPYNHPDAGQAPLSAAKAAATVEGEAGLSAWVGFAMTMVKSGGTLTFIHRADRLEELLSLIAARTGGIVVFPIWPRDPLLMGENGGASRVLMQARVGSKAPLRLAGGLALHEADGRYGAAAESVLRDAAALPLGGQAVLA